jgi:hypothetical protein
LNQLFDLFLFAYGRFQAVFQAQLPQFAAWLHGAVLEGGAVQKNLPKAKQ